MELCIFTEPQGGADCATLLAHAKAPEELGFTGWFRSHHDLAMSTDYLPGPTDAWSALADRLSRYAELGAARVHLQTVDLTDPDLLAELADGLL